MPACPNCQTDNKRGKRKCAGCGLSLVTEWNTKVREAILKTIDEEPDWRFSTIRSMFYYLSDALGLIPATEQGYKKLDELIVKMRKSGDIDFGYFDVARGQSASFSGGFTDPASVARIGINYLKERPAFYSVPRWHRQPVMVEVWCEKKGLMSAFDHHLSGLGVQLRSPEGFSPWEFVNSVIGEIEELMDERGATQLVILYMGDQDPSGVQIYESIIDQFNHFGMEADIKRIGVTPEQIRDLGLPSMPQSAETLAKIGRDPRLQKYLARYGKIFCELDSFVSLKPDAFKDTLHSAVNKYMDYDLLDKREALESRIKEILGAAIHQHDAELTKIRDAITRDIEAAMQDIDTTLGRGDDDDDDTEECDSCTGHREHDCEDCGSWLCDDCATQCDKCGQYYCLGCIDDHKAECQGDEE